MSVAAAIAAALPWIVLPGVTIARARRSATLDEEPATPPEPTPLVSVIVPARNERRNIERCLRSILATTYPSLDVIVVDDHSTDGTGDLARAIAAVDPRVRVIANPDLPPGWFGKQWACATGAADARGELLCFTDADTAHAPDLLVRTVNAMRRRDAALLSVAGTQEMHSFWERVLQPQVFFVLATRYGGTERVSRARRASDVIANGQFLVVRRAAYHAIGGHGAVRDKVAEDLALAQTFHRAGHRIAVVLGARQLSTHMYASLGELIRGWRKNVYAGGRDAMPGGRVGRALFPLLLPLAPLVQLVPVVVLALSLILAAAASTPGYWLTWSAIAVGASVAWWGIIYAAIGQPVWYALLYPLGASLLLHIMLGAIVRGERVEWKGRAYVSR
jgi:chlorobactene glucosyltransferase